ncbi:hypothetical protein BGLA2_420103 [Burkholderia gladioli]|nr:hypothetical protein BGLA2_420103 [Burkholderia gladioli]
MFVTNVTLSQPSMGGAFRLAATVTYSSPRHQSQPPVRRSLIACPGERVSIQENFIQSTGSN